MTDSHSNRFFSSISYFCQGTFAADFSWLIDFWIRSLSPRALPLFCCHLGLCFYIYFNSFSLASSRGEEESFFLSQKCSWLKVADLTTQTLLTLRDKSKLLSVGFVFRQNVLPTAFESFCKKGKRKIWQFHKTRKNKRISVGKIHEIISPKYLQSKLFSFFLGKSTENPLQRSWRKSWDSFEPSSAKIFIRQHFFTKDGRILLGTRF